MPRQLPPSHQESLLDSPLPSNLDAERFLLGAVFTDNHFLLSIADRLTEDDFFLEKHKLLFRRMCELHAESKPINQVTLAEILMKNREIQLVDGISYICSLDDGLLLVPESVESYVEIVLEKSLLRRVMTVSNQFTERAGAGMELAEELITAAGDSFLSLAGRQEKGGLLSPAEILNRYEGGINAFLDTSKRKKGLSTGFLKLDEMTGGLQEGELIILAARPAMGKTAMALNLAQYVAAHTKQPKAVAVFSLEMTRESLLNRMVCAAARVDQHKFRCGYLSSHERDRLQEALTDMHHQPLFIDDTAGTNLMDIHSKLRRLQAEQDLGLVVIDYLQLMQGPKRENRVQEISALSRGLKLMSKALRVPFLVLSQLSRAPETRQGDHRPMLSDLRESGSIEQDADVVAFIFREEVYKPDKESLKGLAELLVAKQRNGPTGRIKLAFLHKFTKFENLAPGYEQESPFEDESMDYADLPPVIPINGNGYHSNGDGHKKNGNGWNPHTSLPGNNEEGDPL